MMTREEFRTLCKRKNVILDGATGSNLMKAGMKSGECPERFILDNREVLQSLQRDYVKAGVDVLYAPTFTCNRIKLSEYGLENQVEELTKELVGLSKEVAKNSDHKVYIAGDLTMTGKQIYPLGEMQFEELVNVYKQQVEALIDAGVDLFVIETMMSLQETRACVLAIKETCDMPIMATLTFNADRRTLYGTNPETAVIVLQAMGVDAVGVNCSTGPKQMVDVITAMRKYAKVPLIAKPNAGMPKLVDNETVYDLTPDEFAQGITLLCEAGAGIVGGCCGTTPEHIEKMVEKIKSLSVATPDANVSMRVLTSERKEVPISLDGRFLVVGERINPTGKKALQESLKVGSLDLVVQMASEQRRQGAAVLDCNLGMSGIDEKEMMVAAVYELTQAEDLPLSIDTSSKEVVEAALRIYPGRALINSISLEPEKIKGFLPLAKKYGAMFVLLPLSKNGLPKDFNEKKQMMLTIIEEAQKIGLEKEDILVDGLVTTVGANKQAAREVLETIEYVKQELHMGTICGLSNVSFGLPQRAFINSTFLAMAISKGLTMAIANPEQTLLMNTALATDLLLAKEDADLAYIEGVRSAEVSTTEPVSVQAKAEGTPMFTAIVEGRKERALQLAKQWIEGKADPKECLDSELIPAINHVGELFNQQIYFLPQLIKSAQAMEAVVQYFEPYMLNQDEEGKAGCIVMATVEGDIHDIGKNLVCLMLKNHGYEVIDLGKDVKAKDIVECAKQHNADIIGLSALMTTTMVSMKKVIEERNRVGIATKIIVGGAVITKEYAVEIGADGYSSDAADCVVLVNSLLHQA